MSQSRPGGSRPVKGPEYPTSAHARPGPARLSASPGASTSLLGRGSAREQLADGFPAACREAHAADDSRWGRRTMQIERGEDRGAVDVAQDAATRATDSARSAMSLDLR